MILFSENCWMQKLLFKIGIAQSYKTLYGRNLRISAQVKHLSGAPVYSRLLALPTNIRLGCKSFPGTNTLTY